MKRVFIFGQDEKYINYTRALSECHADCVVSHDIAKADDCGALLLPGGGDVSPCLYGSAYPHADCVDIKRDVTEQYLIAKFVKRKLPIFGVCRGMQIINVFFGGTLCEHMDNTDEHLRTERDVEHEIVCAKSGFMRNLFGDGLTVNSAHHQCVKILGKGLAASAYAYKNDIEAMEHSSGKIIAVQFHPERMDNAQTRKKIFEYFLSL